MPPKAKFTKEEITEAALRIVREEGIEKLTSRNLGKTLGSSACPIFTVFSSMEEVETAALEAAKAVYKGYVERGLTEELAFRGVGEQYIHFAVDEPRLFQLLFMGETEEAQSFEIVLPMLEESYDKILTSAMTYYGLDRAAAEKLYKHMWIYTHGIACLCATKTCQFSAEEIREMLGEVFLSLLKNVKAKQK